MDHNPAVSVLLQSLMYRGPALLVYITGLVFAIIFLSRSPRAAIITMISLGILIVSAVAFPLLQASIIHFQTTSDSGHIAIGRMMAIAGIVSSCVHATAIGMLLVAVFIDRGTSPFPPNSGEGKGSI